MLVKEKIFLEIMSSLSFYFPCLEVTVCLFGSYVVVSTFFYYFPHLLHGKTSKHKKCDPITVLSHRGGLAEQVENTLAAFEQ